MTLPQPETPQLTKLFALVELTLQRITMPTLPEADGDDWRAEARLAAWLALQAYDPARGVRLETWLISKIRWALVEQKRRWVVNSRAEWARHQARERERDAALAAGTELPEPLPVRPRPLSLDGLARYDLEEEDPFFEREEHRALAVSLDMEGLAEWWSVEAVLPRLPARLQRVLALRRAGQTELEMARNLGISQTRVGQLLEDAVNRARFWLGLTSEWQPASAETKRLRVRDEQLFALYEQGKTSVEIATALRTSETTVLRRLREGQRSGRLAPRPPVVSPTRAAVVELTEAGLTMPEIATRLGVPRTTVQNHRHRARQAGLLPPVEAP